MTLPGTGGTVYFKYDPFGRRIEKIAPTSGTTVYAYDGDNVTEELGGGGNLLAHYTQGAGIDEPLAITGTGGTYFSHADGLGSITSLTDTTGNLAASYVYDSFGNLTASTGTVTNPFQYTAREFDLETGLYYHRARYYDRVPGRFFSEDALRFLAAMNYYPYVQNNPINAKDPTGMKILLCSKGGFQDTSPSGIGNHAYLYDTRNGHNCGRGGQSGKENINAPGTFCVEVPGSDRQEDVVMHCCEKERKNLMFMGLWFPWLNDCQTFAGSCLKQNGLKNPGAPGGRIGCRGNCPAYPENEHFMSGW